MSSKQIPEPWRSFFFDVDAVLDEAVDLHCLGGFVMTVFYDMPRSTGDVDVIAISPKSEMQNLISRSGQGSALHRKHKLYLQFVGVATVPDGYEERLTEIFSEPFQNIRLLALDPYDLALSKLERNSQRDRDDVRYLARIASLDLEKLKRRYHDDLRPYLGNPNREDLTLKLWIEAIQEDRQLN